MIDREEVKSSFLHLFNVQSSKRILRINGSTNMGKTYLIREFEKFVSKNEFRYVSIDLRPNLRAVNQILQSAVNQLENQNLHFSFDNFKSEKELANYSIDVTKWGIPDQKLSEYNQKITRAFVKDLLLFTQNNLLFFFVDAFEQADNDTKKWIDNHLIPGIYFNISSIRMVIAGQNLPTPRNNVHNHCFLHTLSPFKHQHVKEYGKRVGLTEDQSVALYQLCKGNPGFTTAIGPNLREGGSS